MKKMIFITLLFNFTFAFSQTFENFNIDSGQFIWQKVYETESTNAEIIDFFKKSGIVNNIEIKDNEITGNLIRVNLDYRGFGKSEMVVPMYIARNYLNSFILIEIKDGKYRISIKDMKMEMKYDDGLSKAGEIFDLDWFAVKKDKAEFKPAFQKMPSQIINFTFDSLFTIKEIENKNW